MNRLQNRAWRVLRSEYVAREPWFTVRKEALQLPNGNVVDAWYVFEYPAWVNIIARTAGGEFVMQTQYRHGLGGTFYEICAGAVDEGETPLEAAKRELAEETGYGGGRWSEYMVLSPNPTNHNNLVYTFLAEGVEPLPQGQTTEPSEDIEVVLMRREQVRELLDENQIVQALMAAPLWRYMCENGK